MEFISGLGRSGDCGIGVCGVDPARNPMLLVALSVFVLSGLRVRPREDRFVTKSHISYARSTPTVVNLTTLRLLVYAASSSWRDPSVSVESASRTKSFNYR